MTIYARKEASEAHNEPFYFERLCASEGLMIKRSFILEGRMGHVGLYDKPRNFILSGGTVPASSWKSHVSQRGTFFGYSGLVNWISQFWLEESTNAE